MVLSKTNPKYQELDPNKIVQLPKRLQFVVYALRQGKDFRRAYIVVALGCDSNGEVTHLAFNTDSMSFDPIVWYSTKVPT
jgi:hypothetical protein